MVLLSPILDVLQPMQSSIRIERRIVLSEMCIIPMGAATLANQWRPQRLPHAPQSLVKQVCGAWRKPGTGREETTDARPGLP